MMLNILLLSAAVTLMPGICSGEEDNPPLPDAGEAEVSTDDEGTDRDEDTDDDDSFLDTYYDRRIRRDVS
ncbi:MAG: hypothetical protein KAR44_00720 [Candidatus Aegiribacteria sp.]|nr:hypothetical protein [Candidatus Aegiribacteria sp.]